MNYFIDSIFLFLFVITTVYKIGSASAAATRSTAAKVIYTSGSVIHVKYSDENSHRQKEIAAAIWVIDFDQPLYYNGTEILVSSIKDANKFLGATRIICEEGKVMIESHPEFGVPRSEIPRFALSLTKKSHYNNLHLKHTIEFLKTQIYEKNEEPTNRYALTVLFTKNKHNTRYCHSGICIDRLHSCKVQFLAPMSQDWSPHSILSKVNGNAIITETKPFDLRPLLDVPKKTNERRHSHHNINKNSIHNITKRHKHSAQLPQLEEYPMFSHTERPSFKRATRIGADGKARPMDAYDKTNFFRKKWFTHEEYYSLLQVAVKLQDQVFVGSDPNPVMDSLNNIFENQFMNWAFETVLPNLKEMLHKLLEPLLEMKLRGPIDKRVNPGSKPGMGGLPFRRRRLFMKKLNEIKFPKKATEKYRRTLSKNDLRMFQQMRKQFSKPLRKIVEKVAKKMSTKEFRFSETTINLIKEQSFMSFAAAIEKSAPRSSKWRWKANNPPPKTNTMNVPEVKEKEEPIPEPLVVKKKVIPEPCMGLKGPISVAFCIKNALIPLKMANETIERETDRAYINALEDAKMAEKIEHNVDVKNIQKPSLAKMKRREGNDTKLRVLEKKVESAMGEIDTMPGVDHSTRPFAYRVFKRLKDRVRRRRRQINNGVLPEEVYPATDLFATSFLQLFSKTKNGGCDLHQSVKACETARELFKVAGKHGPESGKCVWCTRRAGGAEEGRCAEEEHGAEIEENARNNGIHGVKCNAFTPKGLPPIGSMEQDNPDNLAPIKKPHTQSETKQGWNPGAEVLSDTTVETTMAMIMDRIHREAAVGLSMTVNQTVFRTTNLMLTEEISDGLVEQLSESLTALLSRSVLRSGTKEITSQLVPTVTHILSSSLTMSLTRSPKNDFYCHYCQKFRFYCTYCKTASKEDYEKAYYASYYAAYYSKYYTFAYVDIFAEGFAGEAIVDGNLDRD